jgi:hypothetical protein
MRNKEHFRSLIAGLLMLLFMSTMIFAGCGGGNSEPSGPPMGTPETVNLPDLVIDHYWWEWPPPASSPSVGEQMLFTVGVRNNGNAPANGFKAGVEYWIPGDKTHSWNASLTKFSLPAGQVIDVKIEIQPKAAGVTTFRFWADVEESIAESNENNNVKETSIKIIP